jgi:hypothetical protein
MNHRKQAIESAIADLRRGVFSSQRKAANAYGIPQLTLQQRLNGRKPNAITYFPGELITFAKTTLNFS